MSPMVSTVAATPIVVAVFEQRTYSLQYIVSDPATGKCAIIDPVLDFDPTSATVGTASADGLLETVRQRGWTLEWLIDTHPHADHLSAIAYLRDKTGAQTATGARVLQIQKLWSALYNDASLPGDRWNRIFDDEDAFRIGSMPAKVFLSPGHTLASVTVCAGDAAFVHDTLFTPDSGTARADFPGGSASALWQSIQRILALPGNTRLFTGHDYMPGDRQVCWESSVREQRASNVHLLACPDEASFIRMRENRDATLPLPRLMLHALQVNLRGGELPPAEANGRQYLKIPVGAFQSYSA